jgi:6-phosphogluconolactonase/glucosamine-6-phosphate isomerase/deaminase
MMRERLTHGIFIACGKNKKKSVSKTLEKDGDLAETPARIIHELTQADLFTDIDL